MKKVADTRKGRPYEITNDGNGKPAGGYGHHFASKITCGDRHIFGGEKSAPTTE